VLLWLEVLIALAVSVAALAGGSGGFRSRPRPFDQALPAALDPADEVL
jgi:hypothetical protein